MKCAKKTVLIIEDSQVQALATKLLLESQGANVFCAANGEAGVVMAFQTMPDVILLDIGLPGIDGLEVCRLLRTDARTVEIPVILCTVRINIESRGKDLAGGIIDFIPKDAFFKTVLLATLRGMEIINAEHVPSFP